MTTAPHFFRSTMSLGPTESICFKVSCDARAQWQNGIFHNSRYGIFFLLEEGGKLKLELTSSGLDTIKFRKCTVKSEAGAINKILQWMGSIMGDSIFLPMPEFEAADWPRTILTALHIYCLTVYSAPYTHHTQYYDLQRQRRALRSHSRGRSCI